MHIGRGTPYCSSICLPERLFWGRTLFQPSSYHTLSPRILIELLRAQALKWGHSVRPLSSRL